MLIDIAEFLGRITDRLSTITIAALIAAVAFGSLDYFLDIAMANLGVQPELHAVLLACLLGAIAGIAALLILLARRQKRRLVYDELRRVAELNHCLRNSLEVIVDANYFAESQERRKLVLETIQAMDANLKKLFPTLGVEHRGKIERASTSREPSGKHIA